MDIYKLSDEIPDAKTRKRASSNNSSDNLLIITGMKSGVKNPERVNIFINGKFELSLDLVQVVDYKLKVGKRISAEDLEELRKASEFGKIYQRCLEWVLMRPRSEREVRDYLNKKTYEKKMDKVCTLSIIKELKDKKYIDDQKFAEYWVENRFIKKGMSKKRLAIELRSKGISDEIIDKVLSQRSDEDEILKIIKKKRNRYDDEKLINYLCRQGFSFELAREKVRSYGKD